MGRPHRRSNGPVLSPGPASEAPGGATLGGLRLGVTGSRKGAELCVSLERRGATALLGPTIEADQPAPDAEVLPQIDQLLAAPPDWYVANTGIGSRLLAEVADRHARGDALRAVLTRTRCVARGVKAVGGLRAGLGVTPVHVSVDETDASVAAYLTQVLVAGDHLVVQHSGRTSRVYEELTSLGVTIHTLHPYRTGIPVDDAPARLLIEAACDARLDVVVCTSAIGVDHMMAIAARHSLVAPLVEALRGSVHAAAIGTVTADAFLAHGIEPRIIPQRHRTGELIRRLESWHAEQSA